MGTVWSGSTLFAIEASQTFQQARKSHDFCCDWRMKGWYTGILKMWHLISAFSWIRKPSWMKIQYEQAHDILVFFFIGGHRMFMPTCANERTDSLNRALACGWKSQHVRIRGLCVPVNNFSSMLGRFPVFLWLNQFWDRGCCVLLKNTTQCLRSV